MTLREFRKLLHGCDPEAEVIVNVLGVATGDLRACSISVVEDNAVPDGVTADKVVHINLNVKKVVK